MNKRSYLLIAFLFLCHHLRSQVLPKEGKYLNYRIIGFSFPAIDYVSKYTIEIADGNYKDKKSFESKIIKTVSGETNKMIAEVPFFGRQYTWRIKYDSAQKTITQNIFHHFNTILNDEIDSCNVRFRIIQPALAYKDAYVFLDNHKALYDMTGQPVWFLPEIENKKALPRDLKASPFGTITFLIGAAVYEINYNGDILWKGPGNGLFADTTARFHHEFTRLNNGNYMVLGTEDVWQKMPGPGDSSFTLVPATDMPPDNNPGYRKVFFGTVLEYDRKGNLVWSWKSSSYFNHSDLAYHKTPGNQTLTTTHQNAFFFDETSKAVYVSFKEINRVVKVKYPEGTVLNAYGETYKPGPRLPGRNLFCGQHCCRLSQKGYLYLYDNNTCTPPFVPKLVMMQQPVSENDNLKTIWEYTCTIERTAGMRPNNFRFNSGGNVFELPDQSIFACMGGVYSKVFIVNLDKKVLWSALPEKWAPVTATWEPNSQYRASIISREELETLIWNEIK